MQKTLNESSSKGLRLITKIRKSSLVDGHTTMKSHRQNTSEEKLQEKTTNKTQKISAFKMPLAQGKGYLLPALEKDMREPNLAFNNLSKLFKEKQREKFYAKNLTMTQTMLEEN